MKPALLSIVIVSLLFAACSEQSMPVSPQSLMNGFSYTSFHAHGFEEGRKAGALPRLKQQTHADWVALCVFEFQSTPTSSDIAPNTTGINPVTGSSWQTTSTMEDLRLAIRDAHEQGMKIMLKPHVDIYTGGWRAQILPDMQGRWFAAYTDMMMKYAQLAAEEHVEILCIGVEYVLATQPQYTWQWENLITTLRRLCSAQLIYAANWSGAYMVAQPEYQAIAFWDKLDYMGVDFYAPLTSSIQESPPSVEDAIARIYGRVRDIEATANSTNRTVLITEVGLQSARGALARPYDYSIGAAPDAIPDEAAQELYYKTILASFGNKRWCRGFFWWNWESISSVFPATNYTVDGKSAAAVLRSYFTLAG